MVKHTPVRVVSHKTTQARQRENIKDLFHKAKPRNVNLLCAGKRLYRVHFHRISQNFTHGRRIENRFPCQRPFSFIGIIVLLRDMNIIVIYISSRVLPYEDEGLRNPIE